MDTFFSTKKGGKSSHGNTCCQLFVTDKGFMYVVPMCNKSKVLQAVKLFAKEVGAPDAIILDMSGEQTSKDLRKFCVEIGNTRSSSLRKGLHGPTKPNSILDKSRRQFAKTCGSPTAPWPSGTTVLKGVRASTTSQQETQSNCVDQTLTLP